MHRPEGNSVVEEGWKVADKHVSQTSSKFDTTRELLQRRRWKYFLQCWLYSSLTSKSRGVIWSVPLLGLVRLHLSRQWKAAVHVVPDPFSVEWVWPARLPSCKVLTQISVFFSCIHTLVKHEIPLVIFNYTVLGHVQ